MLTPEQKKDIEFCKTFIIAKISDLVQTADKIKESITPEAMVSIIHIKIFRDCFKDKEFETVEQAWIFMREDMKSIAEKISYASYNLLRIQDDIKNNR